VKAKGRKDFFLKKEAKTFATWCERQSERHALRAKVFWFFFSQKNFFLSGLPA
jgi:hypothetical protein